MEEYLQKYTESNPNKGNRIRDFRIDIKLNHTRKRKKVKKVPESEKPSQISSVCPKGPTSGKDLLIDNSVDSDSDLSPVRRGYSDSSPRRDLPDLNVTGKEEVPTVFRDKYGRLLDVDQERKRRLIKLKDTNVPESEWRSGLVQEREKRLQKRRLAISTSLPFSIYKDDVKVEQDKKKSILWGDPMANILARKVDIKVAKQKDKMTSDSTEDEAEPPNRSESPPLLSISSRSVYSGVPFPNRYNILPGYRWDGIDRSNGWESKRLKCINERNYA